MPAPNSSAFWGGTRHRLIRDSIYAFVQTNLTGLGWLEDRPWHKPVIIRPDAVTDDEDIVPNVVAFADEGMSSTEWEIGSMLEEDRWTCYFDVYAENDTVGLALIHDIRDILKGRAPTIEQGMVSTGPILDVFDFSQPGSPPIFQVELERIEVDRARGFPKEWQRIWYSCKLEVLDYTGAQ